MVSSYYVTLSFAQDMIEFEKSYRESEEEVENVRSAYLDFEGDMDKIMDEVMAP